jgi:hypothetical protein
VPVIVPRVLRTPEQDGALLAEPPLAQVAGLLIENRRLLRSGPDILGRGWDDLRRLAAQETVAAARDYLSRSGEPLPDFQTDSLLLAGHQPDLVHPGVWVKNFALHELAVAHGVTPINLLVDYDTVKSTTLRLPKLLGVDPLQAQTVALGFDQVAAEIPWEEREIQDRALFDSLADRAETVWRTWPFRPLLPEFWSDVRRYSERTSLLGECLAGARREWERRWGCHNGEVPVSALCRTEAFAWFAWHILAELPRFHKHYNDALHEYRRVHGLRSRNHPVPDLAADGDWLEAPFWGWHGATERESNSPRRERLFVRVSDSAIELRAGRSPPHPLTPSPTHALPAAWRALEQRGLKIRPRALTNTLFARLFVADLFIHGIGGAKYDEVTDELIRRFYGRQPPRYLVITGTLRLPLPRSRSSVEARWNLIQRLRSLHYNPQRHLPAQLVTSPVIQELLRQREELIAQQPATRRGRRARFMDLREQAARLRSYVADEEVAVRSALQTCELELEADALLYRRDYAACLFPAELLRGFFGELLRRKTDFA